MSLNGLAFDSTYWLLCSKTRVTREKSKLKAETWTCHQLHATRIFLIVKIRLIQCMASYSSVPIQGSLQQRTRGGGLTTDLGRLVESRDHNESLKQQRLGLVNCKGNKESGKSDGWSRKQWCQIMTIRSPPTVMGF